ncbi:MAG: DUF4230 domain-containing protein, partial [Anaerolineaceae bacterium]|nr:DUF4230 domain-containing protein [Anaerolineaceae bacterium]
MDKKKTSLIFNIVWIVVIIAVLATAIWLVISVQKSITATLSPLQQTNNAISTQISSLLHPTPTVLPDPVTIIRQIRSLARLETIQYTVEKVITAEINQGVFGPLFGDRLLLVAHGMVIAGIDMSKIDSSDIWREDGALHVRLPEAEVFVATLDNKQSYIYDRTTGLFTKGDPKLETAARQAAEQEILKAAV